MKIQRQNKKGEWDTLAIGTPGRISFDGERYIYQFVNELDEKTLYRLTLDAQDIKNIKKESFT